MEQYFFRVSAEDFGKIPGSPVAYWVGSKIRSIFNDAQQNVGNIANPNQALVTGNTDSHIRRWAEVSLSNIGFCFNDRDEAKRSGKKWFPYNKGGDYRNWYGNFDHIVMYWCIKLNQDYWRAKGPQALILAIYCRRQLQNWRNKP
ncbi:MAG: hypothetical protein KAG53_08135 [Endozoicomonadaceae bacterium]|nr:hypothetical protein [Endozoicomonadaceae bacterium]